MRRLPMFAVLAALLLGSPCRAQIYPGPDIMGIYFDVDATLCCWGTGYMMAPVTAYFALTNPTAEEISGWECRLETEISAYLISEWELTAGTNYAVPPDYLVTMELEPTMGTQPITILATMNMLFLGEPTDIAFFGIAPTTDPTYFDEGFGYLDGDQEPVPCSIFSWASGNIVATLNIQCPTPTTKMTWGQVKALY